MSEALNAFKRAEERGLECIVLDDRFIALDLDEGAQYRSEVLEVLLRHAIVVPESGLVTTSQNENKHLYIALRSPQPAAVRTAIQAALNSDGMKEAFAVTRIIHGTNEETEPVQVMFETAEEMKRVRAWLEASFGKEE